MKNKAQNLQMAIISNPMGGYNARKGTDAFDKLAVQQNIPHANASSADEVLKVLKKLAIHKPDLLVINGGDGTVDVVLSLIRNKKIFENEPALALLKGGTTNLIHRDIGMQDSPHNALRKIIDGSGTKIIEHKPLEIKYIGQQSEPLHGFFLGTGAIMRAILHTRKTLHEKGMNGKFSEVVVLSKLLARLAFKRNLSCDEILNPTPLIRNEEEDEHIFLALSTLKKLIPFIKSTATDEEAGVIYMGANRKLQRDKTDNIILEIAEPWMLDGEMQKAGKIEITLGKPVKFLINGGR